MQTKAIIQKNGYFIPCENLHETYPINKEVFIEFKIFDNNLNNTEVDNQEEYFQKMKEDAILERYQEKLKNQIQYTPEDIIRMNKKLEELEKLINNNE